MKKPGLTILAALLLGVLPVWAQPGYQGPAAAASAQPGGYQGPVGAPTTSAQTGGYYGPGQAAITTVRAAASAYDDARVVLEGYVTRRIRHEKYEFQDATGTIVIDVDDDEWPPAQRVDEKVKVRIVGEVDKDFGWAAEIDVKYIEVLGGGAR